jgi:hypothetical protein
MKLKISIVFNMLILTSLLVVCGTKSSWSQAEKQNAQHFINTLNTALEAIRISNQGGPGLMSEVDRRRILNYYKEALKEAKLVQNNVLIKIHPELKNHFRNELQRGIELRIVNFEQGDVSAELEGSRLMDAWADWYIENQNEMRIPK